MFNTAFFSKPQQQVQARPTCRLELRDKCEDAQRPIHPAERGDPDGIRTRVTSMRS